MAAHLTGQLGAGLLHLGLDEALSGLPQQWLTAQFFDSIEKRLARLNVGDDRGPRHFFQHRFGEDGEELIAPDDASLAVDCADAVAIAIESEAEIELPFGHQRL